MKGPGVDRLMNVALKRNEPGRDYDRKISENPNRITYICQRTFIAHMTGQRMSPCERRELNLLSCSKPK